MRQGAARRRGAAAFSSQNVWSKGRRGCALGGRLDAQRNRPERPATGVVLETRQAFQQALVQEGVIVAPYGIPARGHRPLRRNVDLLERFAVVAIACVQYLPGLGRVAAGDGVPLAALLVAVVLRGGIEGPGLADAPANRSEDVGIGGGAQRRSGRQAHAFILEIVALRDRGAQRFLPAAAQKAGGQG